MENINQLINNIREEIYYSRIIAEEDEEKIHLLLGLIPDAYVLISWPDVQELMDEPWFDNEATLDINSIVSDSSYFVPLKRLL